MRRDRGQSAPGWPDWCFLPLGGWYAIVAAELKCEILEAPVIPDVSTLGALGAWRITQGVYTFHPETFAELSKTTIGGELPSDILKRMPEWCFYISTPEYRLSGAPIHGFFVHLEYDPNSGGTELRFLLDTEKGLRPFVLPIGQWPLAESLKRVEQESRTWMNPLQTALYESVYDPKAAIAAAQPLLALVLYICSKDPEYKGSLRPAKPALTRTKKGWRLFPADKPRFWSLGFSTGEAIRRGKEGSTDPSRPKPHIRRAHWHGYWLGPRANPQKFIFHWLPPTPVNVDLLKDSESE